MRQFRAGLKLGIPIALGYFSVSMAYGLSAVLAGLTPLEATVISLTNLTSAGQFAGTGIIAAGGSLDQLVISTLIINARYFLMALSLSQKMADATFGQRLLMAYGVTDEIFAAAIGEKGRITFKFFMGLMFLPIIGWCSGTLVGALASNLLPADVAGACGVAMYGMFIAIVVPAGRKSRKVAECAVLAAAMSVVLQWAGMPSGWSVIMVTIVAAGLMAWRHPEAGNELD